MATFSGKVALVTGGGRGIGRGVALALAKYGAQVALTARSTDEIFGTAAEIRESGGTATAVTGDVSNYADVQRVIAEATQKLGPIDALVNNAGVIGPVDLLERTDPQQWAQAIDINLTGAYYMMREVLPGMRERGYGRILNVGSGAASGTGISRAVAYNCSKAALEMLTKSTAAEYEGTGVCITNVRPGIVDTAMQVEIRSTPEEQAGSTTYERFQSFHEDGLLRDPIAVGEQLVAVLMTDKTGEIVDVRDIPDELVAILAQAETVS